MSQLLTLTKQDAGRTIQLGRGQRMVLELEDISTAGYRWEFTPPDGSVLSLEENEFLPHSGIGGGGIRRFTYRAVNSGRAEILLRLKRSWEANSIDEFQAFVTVSP